MALLVAQGSFAQPTTTGIIAVRGISFKPKLVIFYGGNATTQGSASDATFSFGAAISSTERNCMSGIAQNGVTTTACAYGQTDILCYRIINQAATVLASADFSNMNQDGFSLNFGTVNSTARIINYIALGGSDIKKVAIGNDVSLSTSTGIKNYTSVGFSPDFLLIYTPQGVSTYPTLSTGNLKPVIGFATADGTQGHRSSRHENGDAATTDHAFSYQRTNSFFSEIFGGPLILGREEAFNGFHPTGYTTNATTSGISPGQILWIAIKGIKATVQAITQPTANKTQFIPFSFKPQCILSFTYGYVSNTTIQNTIKNSFGVGIGSNSQNSFWEGESVNVSTTDGQNYVDNTKAIQIVTAGTPTVNAAAVYISSEPTGALLGWTTTDGTAREIIVAGLGGVIGGRGSGISNF